MADILVRGLTDKVVKALKAQARRNGRSLQSEARRIIESAATTGEKGMELEAVVERLRAFRASQGPVSTLDSVDLIREDRDR